MTATARFLVVAALGLCPGAALAGPSAIEAAAGGTVLYRIDFDLSASRVGLRGRADLLAGARLSMTAERSATGALALRLERDLEAPWKLFHLDPRGPFGRQTKVAAVVTLEEASWEALAARRAAHRRFAERRYASWRSSAERKPPLDGAFAFVVIGPARGRFTVELGPDGGVDRVANLLTDRWLSGDFDRFVGTWGPGRADPDSPRGYWFWNRGESRPFRWEPGTYRALAAALRLLGSAPASSAELSGRVDRVVEALAPGIHMGPGPGTAPWHVVRRSELLANGETVLESRAKDVHAAFVRRTLRRSSGPGVEAEFLRLEIERPRSHLRLTVRVEPHDSTDIASWWEETPAADG